MRLRTLLAITAILFALPAIAREKLQPAPAPRAAPEMVTKVYSVIDLVVPSAPMTGEAATAEYQKKTEALVKLVTSMVRPYSWNESGGRGLAEYFDIGCALVVKNTPDAVAEVDDFLEALRRLAPMPVCYEVRLLKVPVGSCERAGVKLARDTTLTDAQVRTLLEAAQSHRAGNVMQFPRVTALDGQTATAKVGDERSFATGIEVTKVRGQIVHVPKNTPVHIGDVLTVQGRVSADGNYVRVQTGLAHTHLVGKAERVPVTTFITPVFEGGSQGRPIPFTQFLEVPDVRKELVEKVAIVPNGGTLVIGGWKEVEESQGKNLPKTSQEFEVVALATVHVVKEVPLTSAEGPHDRGSLMHYPLRRVAAADATRAINEYAKSKQLIARVTSDAASNTVFFSAERDVCRQILEILGALDKEPEQVMFTAMIVQVPRGFSTQSGLNAGGKPGDSAWTLSPREAHMLNELFRAAKGRGECDVLSRPQIQVRDGQTGYVKIGQDYPVPVVGTSASEQKIESVPVGITFRVTPLIAADGKSVRLTANTRVTSVGAPVQLATTTNIPGAPFPVTTFMSVPTINAQTVEAQKSVAFGDTLVLAAGARQSTDHSLTGAVRQLCGEPVETLVIITPHHVRPAPSDVRPAGWFSK